MHQSCLEVLAGTAGVDPSVIECSFLALVKNEPGWSPDLLLSLQALREEGGAEICHVPLCDADIARVFANMTGRLVQELPATRIFLEDGRGRPEMFLTAPGYRDFCRHRKHFRRWAKG